MRILVRFAPPFRRWHRVLGERLAAAAENAVGFEAVGVPVGRGLLALERRLYAIAVDWDASEPQPPPRNWTPDLTIGLAGNRPSDGRFLRVRFNGLFGEQAMLAAVRTGIAPAVVVEAAEEGAEARRVSCGRPALEDRLVCARALEDLLPKLVILLTKAVARLGSSPPDALAFEADALPPSPSAVAFLVLGLFHKVWRRIGGARGRPDHWRLALRRGGHDAFTLLPDDGSRFCADPFVVAQGDELHLFYEDYPYATGKGVVAHRRIAAGDGTEVIGESRVVLEEPHHLSYPLILRHREATYMLPESSAAGCVQLHRADPFPRRWVPDAVLIAGRKLADATPVLHEGRWWLFAAGGDEGSSWDALHLFHAPDLLGPWTPHVGNPVLIDAGASRPAGQMWHENGALMRPVQDCRRGYGGAIAVFRVDRLDDAGFQQHLVRRIEPPRHHGATGIHTINRAGNWEVVDLKVRHPSRHG